MVYCKRVDFESCLASLERVCYKKGYPKKFIRSNEILVHQKKSVSLSLCYSLCLYLSRIYMFVKNFFIVTIFVLNIPMFVLNTTVFVKSMTEFVAYLNLYLIFPNWSLIWQDNTWLMFITTVLCGCVPLI